MVVSIVMNSVQLRTSLYFCTCTHSKHSKIIYASTHLLPGFNSYVGYLLLEHTHANPVLVTFCQLLIKTLIDKQPSENEEHVLYANHVEDVQGCSSELRSMVLSELFCWHL